MSTEVDEFDEMFVVQLPGRPYPGLRPFEKNEWPIFFGRERMSDAIVRQLLDKHLLVIHGDSGCGKSSLVRAGVLPRLEQENARGFTRWRTCTTLPRLEPAWNLARALALLARPDDDALPVEFLRVLNQGHETPARIVALLDLKPRERVCILIDQFEEIFAHARLAGPQEGMMLARALVELFENPPAGLYVVLTMRSEYLGACARFAGFAEVVNATQYLVPAMQPHDLARAIREPAALFGGEVTMALTESLIADTNGFQDALPLIQHGLMVLHQDEVVSRTDVQQHGDALADMDDCKRVSWRLGLQHLESRASLADLLSHHADDVMERAVRAAAPHEDAPVIVENLFRALTDIDADTRGIRRPQRLSELARGVGYEDRLDTLRAILNVYRADGVSFLSPYGTAPLQTDDLIDISHEALIRCWKRLANPKDGWMLREFRDGMIWRSLLLQAESFEQDPSQVLGPTATIERSKWINARNPFWAQRYGGGWDKVQQLLEASGAERERQLAEQEASQLREEKSRHAMQKYRATRRLLIVGAAFLVITMVASLLTWTSYQRAHEAELQQRADADRLREALNEIRKAQVDLLTLATNSTIDQDPKLKAQIAAANQTLGKVANPVLFIQIADDSQRTAAAALGRRLAAYDWGAAPPRVPGIERVANAPTRSELRCFSADYCKTVGPELVERINASLDEPQVVLKDLTTAYAKDSSIRPQQFELWFAKGPITVRPATK